MPNRLFQTIVNHMRDSIDRNIGVVDESGSVIACSSLARLAKSVKVLFLPGYFQELRPVWTAALIKPSEALFILNMPYFLMELMKQANDMRILLLLLWIG